MEAGRLREVIAQGGSTFREFPKSAGRESGSLRSKRFCAV